MRKIYPHVIVLQHDAVVTTVDVIVAPLVPPSSMTPGRLNPLLTLLGQSVILQAPNLVAVPRSRLRKPVDNLSEERSRIIAAIDMLFAGS